MLSLKIIGNILSIIGEGGLGKSRLKIELREGLPKGVRWLEGRCYAHTQTTSYAPFIQILIRNLLHISDLPDRLQSLVLERSDGNPLFLEEIVRTLIEGQVLRREGDRRTAVGEVGRPVIHSLLRGVIAARIDHLPTAAKVVLQHASVVGRVFTYRAIQMLTNSDGDLDRSLAHLLRVDFIREQARLPEVEYLFKHVLTQEAAYPSILNEQRQSLHRKVAILFV